VDEVVTAPAALLVASDAENLQRRVCGMSVLSRLVCSLDRASAGVHVAVVPGFAHDVLDEAKRAVAARPKLPRVYWGGGLGAIAPERGLLIALRPAVIDHRICQALTAEPDAVVRFRRGGETVLWLVGPEHAANILAAVRGRSDLAAALESQLEQLPGRDVDAGADLCEPVDAGTDMGALEEKLIHLGRKASDTWIAKIFDRRISLFFSRRLLPFDITPNQITFGATAIGLLGALLLGAGTYWSQLLGALLLTFAIIVDGCDGELARIKYLDSDFGRKLDFFLDNVVNVASIFAVGAGHYWQGGPFFYLWASAINATAALASVFPVYWLFFRNNKESVRPGAVATESRDNSWLAFAEDISGRDFAYAILALAVIGRAYWFTIFALFGLTIFFLLVLGLMLQKMRRA